MEFNTEESCLFFCHVCFGNKTSRYHRIFLIILRTSCRVSELKAQMDITRNLIPFTIPFNILCLHVQYVLMKNEAFVFKLSKLSNM